MKTEFTQVENTITVKASSDEGYVEFEMTKRGEKLIGTPNLVRMMKKPFDDAYNQTSTTNQSELDFMKELAKKAEKAENFEAFAAALKP